ncbi:endonuclease/exonuclease/phosphatase family protein, partial [Parvibaculum sp.]|uniref:endonuclease/exonuclease/phosphatase family protein n=1 Tax=Parvibaculum sp. TaxID=2024848 RepID=UPI003C7794C0
MTLKIATWNINSVRLRINLVERLIAEEQPDVLCLQEIKCVNDAFPMKAVRQAGYEHVA